MSTRELHIMQACIRVYENGITKHHAAEGLGMSVRNFYRRYERWMTNGEQGLVHRNRGKAGNRRYDDTFKTKVLALVKNNLQRYNAVHATEVLRDEYDIRIHPNTLRRWIQARSGSPPSIKMKKHVRAHRQWRPRKESFGELIQADGSFHRWFGPDYPPCCLLAMIDDATGEIFAQFDTEEHAQTMMRVLRSWIAQHGIPHTLYFDRRNAYLPSETNQSYIPAVCNRLGIRIINAHSPQAKGRVERLFRTLQDRLPKELMRSGITTIHEANIFLQEYYIQKHNAQFSRAPHSAHNAHVTIDPRYNMDLVWSMHAMRTVRHDWTITHHGRIYQIPKHTPAPIYPRTKVLCATSLDDSVHVYHNNTEIPVKEVQSRMDRT